MSAAADSTSTRLDVNVKLRLTAQTNAELERIAANEDRSVASVMRRAIRFYLEERRAGRV